MKVLLFKIWFFFFLSIITLGCSNPMHNKRDKGTWSKYGNLSFQPLYHSKLTVGSVTNYKHFLLLKGFNETDSLLYKKTNKIVRNYIDSVSNNTPVGYLHFLKSANGFPTNMDNEHIDMNKVYKEVIASYLFSYTSDTIVVDDPYFLHHIEIFNNDNINNMDLSEFNHSLN